MDAERTILVALSEKDIETALRVLGRVEGGRSQEPGDPDLDAQSLTAVVNHLMQARTVARDLNTLANSDLHGAVSDAEKLRASILSLATLLLRFVEVSQDGREFRQQWPKAKRSMELDGHAIAAVLKV